MQRRHHIPLKWRDSVNFLLRIEISDKIWLINIDAFKTPDLPIDLLYLGDDSKEWDYDCNAEGDGCP